MPFFKIICGFAIHVIGGFIIRIINAVLAFLYDFLCLFAFALESSLNNSRVHFVGFKFSHSIFLSFVIYRLNVNCFARGRSLRVTRIVPRSPALRSRFSRAFRDLSPCSNASLRAWGKSLLAWIISSFLLCSFCQSFTRLNI